MKFTVDFMLSKVFQNVNNNPKNRSPTLVGGEGDRGKKLEKGACFRQAPRAGIIASTHQR
jgi:hypothetical protein